MIRIREDTTWKSPPHQINYNLEILNPITRRLSYHRLCSFDFENLHAIYNRSRKIDVYNRRISYAGISTDTIRDHQLKSSCSNVYEWILSLDLAIALWRSWIIYKLEEYFSERLRDTRFWTIWRTVEIKVSEAASIGESASIRASQMVWKRRTTFLLEAAVRNQYGWVWVAREQGRRKAYVSNGEIVKNITKTLSKQIPIKREE